MSQRSYRVKSDVDVPGMVWSFLFGIAVGAVMAYPALPEGWQVWQGGSDVVLGPVAGPLLIGVALFLFFFLGVFALNWLFIEADD